MAKKNSITTAYDALPFIAKLLIIIFGGVIVGGIYRIIKYFESGKSVATLVVGLLATFTGIGNVIIWIVDVVTTVMHGKFTVFAD